MKADSKSLLKVLLLGFSAAALAFVTAKSLRKKKLPTLQQQLFNPPGHPYPVGGKFIYRSATHLAAMIRNGEATSVEIVQEHINHIKNNNWKINALVWLFEEEALEAARKADEMVSAGHTTGMLHGVPVTIKEHFWFKGWPSNVNTRKFSDFVAPRHSHMVENLLKEGAIILGSTNIPEMLMDYQAHGQVYPTASNPYHFEYTPGGSTGGEAAAIASGFSTAGLGSDLIGSIRVPASFCGLYGLKTTEYTLDLFDGGWPADITRFLLRDIAVAGPLARTIDDLELMWSALKRDSEYNHLLDIPIALKQLKDYRIAWFDNWEDKIYTGNDVREKLDELIGKLTTAGAATTKDVPAYFTEMLQVTLIMASFSWFFDPDWITRKFVSTASRLIMSNRIDYMDAAKVFMPKTEDNYAGILHRRRALVEEVNNFFKNYDLLILPVAAGPAIRKGPLARPLTVDGHKMFYWDYFAYAQCFNATGNPALAIPLGLNKEGLPIGIQVVGGHFSERKLIHFARLLEPLQTGFVNPFLMENAAV
jgi:amidase